MRTLTQHELAQVSGGDLFSEANVGAATRLVRGMSYLGMAFSTGYAIGTFIYNAGLDELIANQLDD
jgi:bacteriocin-like protein